MSENTHHNTMRTALITGATRGLGYALAHGLARRGWNLVIDGRDAARLRRVRDELAEITHVAALAGDVTDDEHRRQLAVLARGHAGLDALVNNAGALGPSPLPSVLELDLESLIEVLLTNVVAPVALIQALRGELKPGARLINVTSDAAVNPYLGWGGYGASKAAVEQISSVLATELATTRPDLRVYWVDPGDMRTDMHQAAFPGEDISDRPLPETRVPAFVRLLEEELPSGRYEASRLIARASDDAAANQLAAAGARG
ncbi:MAG TPA: SDR family oxidoreductase [Gemmatimonadaceae bacterium]|jgi:NAD(P)-dependent dehydrogenase (short-subunit alcohol dehydrogenase family)|nr:SDR family oxidoreductase [Gemmatimonadaceae bacterium]